MMPGSRWPINVMPRRFRVVSVWPRGTRVTWHMGSSVHPCSPPLITTVVGHPAWRFEPSYLDVRSGHQLRVTNTGGENHTFTEVAAFGGGVVPPFNGVGAAGKVPLTPAAVCVPPPGTTIVGPGSTVEIKGLS